MRRLRTVSSWRLARVVLCVAVALIAVPSVWAAYWPNNPPTLPAKGGKYTDPSFGATVMRVTDATDGGDWGNAYSYWPTFNKNNTHLLVDNFTNGVMYVQHFDATNFLLVGSRSLLFPTNPPGGGSPGSEDVIWSGVTPTLIYCHEGLKLWSYDVDSATWTLIKDFAGAGLPGIPDYLWQMSRSVDDNVFGFTVKNASWNVTGYIAWKRDTNQIKVNVADTTFDEVQVDKSGRYLVAKLDAGVVKIYDMQLGTTDTLTDAAPDYAPGHSDNGTGTVVGADNWLNRMLKRSLATPHSFTTVYDMGSDWTQDTHISFLGDDESKIEMSRYTGITPAPDYLRDEIFLISTDGNQTVTHVCHHYSDTSMGYSATPKADISRDGRYIAYVSNYANQGRCDMFIVQVPGGTPQPPVANFTGNPTSGTAPLTVAFTDASTNSPTSWSWNFGDSSTSTAQSPSHVYTSTGSYTVSLRATNASGYDDEVKTNYITASTPPAPPVASFTGTPTSGAAPLAVTFTDTSTGSPTSWSWNFGDSTTSTSQNPSHTYSSVGAYTVSLRATNAAGYDDEVKTSYISVTGQTTIFSDNFESAFSGWTKTGTPDWYTGSPKNGTHSIQLRGGGTAESFYRTVSTAGYTSITVTFYMGANSLDNANEYVEATWYNGSAWAQMQRISDGQEDNLLHAFSFSCPAGANSNANFAIKFAIAGSGTNDYGFVDDVAVKGTAGGGSPPVANFTGTPTSGTAPLAMSFTDTSTNSPTSWSWNFGDSSTSTTRNPSHTYSSAGTYTVSLRATNAGGYDDEVKTNYITVSAGGSPPVANFTGTPVNGQASLAVSFTDTSTNTPTSWSWTFGDSSTSTTRNPSHTYTTAGDYTVALTATNSYGSNTNTKTNYITVSAANEVIVYPDTWAANSYTPGVALQSGGLSDLTTDNAGYMVIRCDNSTQRYGVMYTVDTIYTPSQVSNITWEYQAKVSRSDTPTSGVVFARKSDGVWESRGSWVPGTTDTNWTWNSTAVSTYMTSAGVVGFELCTCPSNANNYDVSSDKMRFRLQLVTVQPPVADFTGNPTSGTKPLTVAFTDTSTNTPTSWSWNFGDSSTSTAQNPSHTYNSAGTFNVSLTATNAAGSNTNTKTSYITVNPQEVYVYPDAYSIHGNTPGVTLVAGGLSNLQASDDSYMQFRCNSSHDLSTKWDFNTSYTPAQVSKITVEWELHNSRADTPSFGFLMMKQDGSGGNTGMGSGLWTTTDQWLAWNTTSVSTHMSSSGYMQIVACGCHVNANNYDTYFDTCRIKLTLN